jgi:hypothetical protein
MVFFNVAQRSLRLLTQFNVPLTDEESQSILVHDGQYLAENKPYAHKECWLALLLHQADVIACRVEKNKWESVQ